MALTNIEYGSLASSETINKNFLYLDDRISETTENISTSISSVLSNIATINSRLGEMAEDIKDNNLEFNSKLSDFKTKTKQLISLVSMVPNWSNCFSIEDISSYEATSNGYLLVIPNLDETAELQVNNKTIVLAQKENTDSKSSQIVSIPLFKGDRCSYSVGISQAYFVPVREIQIRDF